MRPRPGPFGLRLGPMIGLNNVAVDFVPVLVFDWPIGFPEEDFGRLIGQAASPLPDGRVPLYICAECGDLGCGAVTAVIDRTDDMVVWRDFGYQNDYEVFDVTDVFERVGPFAFDRADYGIVRQQFRDQWSVRPSSGDRSE